MLLGILLIVYGVLSILAPGVMWFLLEGWKIKDAQPSEAAITFGRVFGAIALVVGILRIVL